MSGARDDSATDAVEPTRKTVETALRDVTGPDVAADVVTAGLVEEIDVTDGVVTVDTAMASLDNETADLLTDRMRTAILELPGVEQARVEAERPAPDHETVLPGVDRVLAVASAKGGVGKTTVATQLARAMAADGERVGLFDADVYGPNTPDLLDIEGPLESTDDGAAKPIEVDGVQVVSVGLIANNEPMAWRGAMAHEAVEELLTDAAWEVDTLVIDLPPGTGDIVLTTLQSLPIDGTVLVTTPFPTAAGDTERSATLFREEGVPILGTVVNMAGFTCPTCGDTHAPFGDDPDLDTEPLAELPIDETLQDTDGGVPLAFRKLQQRVRDEFEAIETVPVPADALDLRGVPDRARIEQVRAEFDALQPGDSLHIVTDRQPGGVGAVLEDLSDTPPEVTSQRKGPDRWAIRIRNRKEEAD